MNYRQLWREINSNNIKQHYYGIPENIRGNARFIKQRLGTKEYDNIPKGIADMFNVVYEASIRIYQPVNNTAFFHDKFKDMFIFFDITNQNNPKAILAITGYEMENIDDFDKFLRHIKRNKWVI
jgi:hypothetical protein